MKALLLFIPIILIVVGVLIYIALRQSKSADNPDKPWPYYLKKPLTEVEQVLYYRLAKCLPNHVVLAQVHVSRLLGVKKGSNPQEWLNRIIRLSVDYAICARDLSVVAIIELDDATHNTAARKGVDARKDKAFLDAGIKVLRWNVKSLPDDAAIIKAVSGS